jgi:hypothetical protein
MRLGQLLVILHDFLKGWALWQAKRRMAHGSNACHQNLASLHMSKTIRRQSPTTRTA